MLATVVVHVLEAIFIAALTWAVYKVVRWLLTRGGTPVTEEGALTYRLRSGMRPLSYGALFLGVWLMRCAWLSRQDAALCVMELTFGALSVCVGAFTLSTRMVIDHSGLHYFRWPDRCTTIPWASMGHFEVMRIERAASNVYFIRSKTGATIAITDTAYDAEDLMARIQERVTLRQHPYVRRKWYGG